MKINLDQSLLNLCGTILDGGFVLNKKKLKNTGISITESLTRKRMELQALSGDFQHRCGKVYA